MTKISSADKEKFVVRMSTPGLRKRIEEAARAQHMSMNAFVEKCILDGVNGWEDQNILLAALREKLNAAKEDSHND